MPLLTIIIVIVLVGILLWAVNTYLPLDPTIKKILNVVVVIVLIVWLLKSFGLFEALGSIRI